MISEHTQTEGVDVDFLDWLHESYFPDCVANGMMFEVLVQSEHDIGAISIDLVYDEADFHKKIEKGELLTYKVNTLEKAKVLGAKLIGNWAKVS